MKFSAVLLGVVVAAAPSARAQDYGFDLSFARAERPDLLAQVQEGGGGGTHADVAVGRLARRLQDPLSDLASLQLDYEAAFNRFGDGRQHRLDLEPVIPLPVGGTWRLVARAILPLEREPEPIDETGFGDLTLTFHLTPATRGDRLLRVGAGAALLLPTASRDDFGSDKYSIGPSGGVVTVQGPWVAGVIARDVWSIGGSGDRRVSELVAEPLVHYNLDDGWSIGSEPTIRADWKASGGSVWTLPLGIGIARIFQVGPNGVVPLHLGAGAYYNVVHPDDGPLWSMRFELSFLIPARR